MACCNSVYEESQVIEVGTLEEEFQIGFKKKWALQFDDASTYDFDTEEEACAFQRGYRIGLRENYMG